MPINRLTDGRRKGGTPESEGISIGILIEIFQMSITRLANVTDGLVHASLEGASVTASSSTSLDYDWSENPRHAARGSIASASLEMLIEEDGRWCAAREPSRHHFELNAQYY